MRSPGLVDGKRVQGILEDITAVGCAVDQQIDRAHIPRAFHEGGYINHGVVGQMSAIGRNAEGDGKVGGAGRRCGWLLQIGGQHIAGGE